MEIFGCSYSVGVITWDFESQNPGSNPGKSSKGRRDRYTGL